MVAHFPHSNQEGAADLDFTIFDDGQDFTFRVSYNTELFDPTVIDGIAVTWRQIMNNISISNPTSLSTVLSLPIAEKQLCFQSTNLKPIFECKETVSHFIYFSK